MNIYWGPQTGAIRTHLLLDETGEPYEAEKIDIDGDASKEDWFKANNPKSKVSTLKLGGGHMLTEFGPINVWLARSNLDVRLLPTDLAHLAHRPPLRWHRLIRQDQTSNKPEEAQTVTITASDRPLHLGVLGGPPTEPPATSYRKARATTCQNAGRHDPRITLRVFSDWGYWGQAAFSLSSVYSVNFGFNHARSRVVTRCQNPSTKFESTLSILPAAAS